MKVSELIKKLQSIKKDNGDIEVICMYSLGERASCQKDIINGMVYESTVESVQTRTSPTFPEVHVLVSI